MWPGQSDPPNGINKSNQQIVTHNWLTYITYICYLKRLKLDPEHCDPYNQIAKALHFIVQRRQPSKIWHLKFDPHNLTDICNEAKTRSATHLGIFLYLLPSLQLKSLNWYANSIHLANIQSYFVRRLTFHRDFLTFIHETHAW